MHHGNLAFQLATASGPAQRGVALHVTPVYGMLSVAYAPVRGVELSVRPHEQEAWDDAAHAGRGVLEKGRRRSSYEPRL
jgi:hypothetical protein